jgi:hypothetical protein
VGSLRLSGVFFASCAVLSALVFNVRAEEAERRVSLLDQLRGKVPKSIAGNPAAVNNLPGTGLAGRVFHLPEKSGLRLGGLWHQTGVLQVPNGISQNGTGGFYMFGGQRLWCNSHNRASPDGVNARDGKSKVAVSALDDRQSISAFFQFGVNNSGTLPVNR